MNLFRRGPFRGLLAFALATGLTPLPLALSGCRQSTEKLNPAAKSYSIKGTVIAVGPRQGEITLAHDAVPGLMGAMTMSYLLAHFQVMSELHPGDVIRARLVLQPRPDGSYDQGQLDEIAILAQAKPNFRPQSDYHVPTPGDPVPNFRFTDQDGRAVDLQHFRGQALLITFIYTRCPMNDFCPRMSRNFAAVRSDLQKSGAAYDRTHLLSISFDPAYDSPSVLKAYGKDYAGAQGFANWSFVAPDKQSLPALEHFFNVGVTPGDNGGPPMHSLSTVLVGPDGKIAAWYPGSEWAPAEVAAKIKLLTHATA